MKKLIIFVALVIAASICLTAKAPAVGAQSCETAPAPDCPYGYYDAPPYDCAPFGYYGPEWFPNGVFVGAGPWFNGPDKFHGFVDNHLDPPNAARNRTHRSIRIKILTSKGMRYATGAATPSKTSDSSHGIDLRFVRHADSGLGTASNRLSVISRILNLGFQSPIPQVVRIESDAEKIACKESKFRRAHSDDTDDDAICSSNDPALPQLLPDEDRRKDSQKTRQIIKPQHFLPLPPSIRALKTSRLQ
jgi:hypothetical protein